MQAPPQPGERIPAGQFADMRPSIKISVAGERPRTRSPLEGQKESGGQRALGRPLEAAERSGRREL